MPATKPTAEEVEAASGSTNVTAAAAAAAANAAAAEHALLSTYADGKDSIAQIELRELSNGMMQTTQWDVVNSGNQLDERVSPVTSLTVAGGLSS